MIGIYKITSPTKRIYIGQSLNIEERFNTYKRLHCKQQIRLYNSFLKYGIDKHKFEILCECNIEELNNKERYYQDAFSAIGKNGLNCRLTASNDRTGKISEKSRKKMSDSQIGRKQSEETIKKRIETRKWYLHSEETKNKLSKSHKGKIMSSESKLKMSNTRTGIKLSEETKSKMRCKKHTEESKNKISEYQKGKIISYETKLKMSKIILNTETGIYYFGAKEASESINIKLHTLRKKLSGILKNKTSLIYT